MTYDGDADVAHDLSEDEMSLTKVLLTAMSEMSHVKISNLNVSRIYELWLFYNNWDYLLTLNGIYFSSLAKHLPR